MTRHNSEGEPVENLHWILRDRRKVAAARKIDQCLVCRRGGVSESGLCEYCVSGLDGELLELAVRWRSGVGP